MSGSSTLSEPYRIAEYLEEPTPPAEPAVKGNNASNGWRHRIGAPSDPLLSRSSPMHRACAEPCQPRRPAESNSLGKLLARPNQFDVLGARPAKGAADPGSSRERRSTALAWMGDKGRTMRDTHARTGSRVCVK